MSCTPATYHFLGSEVKENTCMQEVGIYKEDLFTEVLDYHRKQDRSVKEQQYAWNIYEQEQT